MTKHFWIAELGHSAKQPSQVLSETREKVIATIHYPPYFRKTPYGEGFAPEAYAESHEVATLMAAAPALLEALEAMLSDVEAYQANPSGHAPTRSVAAVKAAIKKAKVTS